MADPEHKSKISRPAWAKAISDLRLHLKLSQADPGARTGFSVMTVSRWQWRALELPPLTATLDLEISCAAPPVGFSGSAPAFAAKM